MENSIDMKIVEEPKKTLSMNPKKFALWIFMASVMMLFLSLTSAYIVRRAEGNWVYFDLPTYFYYSSFIAVLGSVFMQVTYIAAKKELIERLKLMIVLASISGILFLISQWLGFVQMVNEGHYFAGNPSESFTYVLPWLHGVHIVSAIIFLLFVLVAVFRKKINLAQIEMCATYWHFLGGLWLYLFVFLILYR